MNKNMIKRAFALAMALVLCLGLASSALAACNASITASSLNARAGIGTEHKVLKALPRDTTVYYLGVSDVDSEGNIWYKVQYGEYNTGWVSAKYVNLNSNVVTTSYCQADTGSSYIRSNPNLDGSVIGGMEQGSTAVYLGQICTDYRGVDWYYVNYNGTYGWVSSMYTQLYSESLPALGLMPSLPAYGSTAGTLKAERGDVYIRAAANLNGSQLGVLKNGYSASYLNERSVDERGVVWFRVNYNGTVGWVSSRYGMLYGNAAASSAPSASASNYIYATGGDCNVRKTPNLNGVNLGVLEEGERAPYLGESSTDDRGVIWYKVKFEGKTGWISSMYAGLNRKTTDYGSSTGSYVVAEGNSNIRREPILDGKILGAMKTGETATFTGSTSTDERGVVWYKVKFDGVTGWVSSKYTDLK